MGVTMAAVTSPRTLGLSQSFFLQDEARVLRQLVDTSFDRPPLSNRTKERCKEIFQGILEVNRERASLLSSQERVDHLFSLYRDTCVSYLSRDEGYVGAVAVFAEQVPWFSESIVAGIAKCVIQKYIHTYYQGLASVAIAEVLNLPIATTRIKEFIVNSPLIADFEL